MFQTTNQLMFPTWAKCKTSTPCPNTFTLPRFLVPATVHGFGLRVLEAKDRIVGLRLGRPRAWRCGSFYLVALNMFKTHKQSCFIMFTLEV